MRAQRAIDRAERTADPPLTPPLQGGKRAELPPRTSPSRLRVQKGVSREAAKDCDPDVLTHPTKSSAPLRRQGAISLALCRVPGQEMDACLRRQAGSRGLLPVIESAYKAHIMRAIYLCFAVISLAAAALVWTFIAGWAGRVVFAPDMELLATGQLLSWLAFMALMYGPIAIAGWLLLLAWRKSP